MTHTTYNINSSVIPKTISNQTFIYNQLVRLFNNITAEDELVNLTFTDCSLTDDTYRLPTIADNIRSIEFINFDFNKLTTISKSFMCKHKLENVAFINCKTPCLSYAVSAFCDCSNLSNISFVNFDTSFVFDMSSMFYDCSMFEIVRFKFIRYIESKLYGVYVLRMRTIGKYHIW